MKWRSKRNARRKQSPDWCSFTIRNFIPESAWTKDAWQSFDVQLPRHVWFRLRNDRHVVSFWYSPDGRNWTKADKSCETSGYHHNMAGEFLSLRPGIYAAGCGEVVFRNFKYKTL